LKSLDFFIYRKRYENTLLSSVIGIGPGSMRIETELNEDGTLKKKKGGGYPAANESSWYDARF